MSKKNTIEEMRSLAQLKGGECLSNEYVDSHTKLEWKCALGHIWQARPNDIKSNYWCPECAGTKKLDIHQMKDIAKSRDGVCLSTTYTNSRTKLMWRCKKGHEWSATPKDIKRGKWCPKCAGVTKSNISEMQLLARSFGGKCLSSNYTNNKIKLEWQCKHGHTWFASANDIKSGHWCPECAGTKSLDIEQMKALAETRGGTCLSTIYTNTKTDLEWMCDKGHKWKSTPASIKNGHWCPICSDKAKLDILTLNQIAKSKGGKLISEEYINRTTKLKWICNLGHIWAAPASSIVSGHWCPECSRVKKLTIEEMHILAESHNGKCLSTEYKNNSTRLLWECEKNHTWYAKPNDVKNGSWCAKCAGLAKLNIDHMHELARRSNGRCLSSEYKNAYSPLLWECDKKHTWKTSAHDIKRGTWCPVCRDDKYVMENLCRYILEEIFNTKFPKEKRIFGTNLELDGFAKELKIAFEYNGRQHYFPIIPYFHKTTEEFNIDRANDNLKRYLCPKNGITLLIIPFTVSRNPKKLLSYIIRLLNFHGIPCKIDVENFMFDKFYNKFDSSVSLDNIV